LESIFDKEARVKLQQHYRLKDVAAMCCVSEKSVYRWVYEGKLKAHKIAGSIRIPRTELLKIIQPFIK
jgi:excisionase family DNA binding protein